MSRGRYYRRGHWANRPKPKSAKGSGWVLLAAVAAIAWFWNQGGTEQSTPTQPPSSVSEPAPPAQVMAPEQVAEAGQEAPPEPTGAP